MDVSMPIMDGIEAIHICEGCPDTHVVMLSVHNTPEYVQRALQAGAAGYILKDDTGNELVEAVRTLQKGKSYFSPKIARIVRNLRDFF